MLSDVQTRRITRVASAGWLQSQGGQLGRCADHRRNVDGEPRRAPAREEREGDGGRLAGSEDVLLARRVLFERRCDGSGAAADTGRTSEGHLDRAVRAFRLAWEAERGGGRRRRRACGGRREVDAGGLVGAVRELPVPDVRSRLQAIETLLAQGLGKPGQADEPPTPRLPANVAAVKEMGWGEMQVLFASLYVDEIGDAQRVGGERLVRSWPRCPRTSGASYATRCSSPSSPDSGR
jgi:hypothetical protein